MKDLDPLHYFLGIKTNAITSGLYLTQSKYIYDLILKTNMDGSKPVSTPIWL